MIYARFNATDYKLENLPTLSFSASETTFSEIVVDFTGKTASDLPIKYQEIQIVDTSTDPDTVLYYGYCTQPSLPAFDGTQSRVLLNIELVSPQTYLTKRTITIGFEDETIHDAIDSILADIVAYDGFTIALNQTSQDEYISGYFAFRTIESLLTSLGSQFNFIWFVDEHKNIYIKDLDYLMGSDPIYSITSSDMEYLKYVQPYFNASDYANKINFKNVNYICTENLLSSVTNPVNGTTYTFDYPFSISKKNAFRLPGTDPDLFLITNGSFTYYVQAIKASKTITKSNQIGFLGVDDDNPAKLILLERDTNDPDLIVGMKWKTTTTTLIQCTSESAIKKSTITYIDPVEIENNAGKLNTSGIVERDIDVNFMYYTYKELTRYAKTFLRQNNKQADTVDLKFNGKDLSTLKTTLKLTEKVIISLPDQFINENEYIITNTEFSINNETQELLINAKRSSLTENYIDIFRKDAETDTEPQAQFMAYYSQDENTIISHKVIVDGVEVDV